METIFNQFIFNQFKEKFNGKTLNEILGCAKLHCFNLSLIKDVCDYNNNEFAFDGKGILSVPPYNSLNALPCTIS